jgi:hypothetical protein
VATANLADQSEVRTALLFLKAVCLVIVARKAMNYFRNGTIQIAIFFRLLLQRLSDEEVIFCSRIELFFERSPEIPKVWVTLTRVFEAFSIQARPTDHLNFFL